MQYFRPALRIVGILCLFYAVFGASVFVWQRSLLYFPTHDQGSTVLMPWSDGTRTIGYCREVPKARAIWLMMHGNAGQAAHRDYVLGCMSDRDSLYVLEYPGYGSREGSPSLEAMNHAAAEAYRLLRSRYPNIPICVLGESIGSGPACALARANIPPDKIVLIVPFDVLAKVAGRKYPILPVSFILRDAWDNVTALEGFAGPLEIFGAQEDTIIPIEHARALARRIPGAQWHAISGGHNEWSDSHEVKIRYKD